MFQVLLFDEDGNSLDLGSVKIGFQNQTTKTATHSTLTAPFEKLSNKYFSVGQDVSYYRKLRHNVNEKTRNEFLKGLRDIVIDPENLFAASGQDVLKTSLLRSVSISMIDGQFKRVLDGGALLTNFNFGFFRPQTKKVAGIDLQFKVLAHSTPSTNIHAIIGRNGVGKTTLLNEMIAAIVGDYETDSQFYTKGLFERKRIGKQYFSSLISVSFSAFDPFKPPHEQPDPEKGTRYYYIGLKDLADDTGTLLKSLDSMRDECIESLLECFSDKEKTKRWKSAILTLESDDNFAQMNLSELAGFSKDDLKTKGRHLIGRMSSGHAVVLLTLSRLVAKVEEQTLILLDEPESHLHPPLLSAFTRALSELLRDRNGVAIVATHSPVVLQEIPRSCALFITRSRLSMHVEPPRIETFGENVGVLTREVFGLEVSKSGFHSLMKAAVNEGKTYEQILSDYDQQIGLEARGILRAMIAERDDGI
jgi:predicted ATPase